MTGSAPSPTNTRQKPRAHVCFQNQGKARNRGDPAPRRLLLARSARASAIPAPKAPRGRLRGPGLEVRRGGRARGFCPRRPYTPTLLSLQRSQKPSGSSEPESPPFRALRPGAGLGGPIMSNFEDADTEETVTCLQLTVYHPGHLQRGIFQSINFSKREKLPSSEVVKFGRNSTICHYIFQDKQASRVQFSLHPFRQFNSCILSFEIKNLSKKTILIVDSQELGYLNKMDLPYRPLLQENSWPAQSPVPEDGTFSSGSTQSAFPTEMDENEW
ncbi:PREDICTED: TRAF-interacting protein with FHA domain-containing protein A isoform X2 [Chinchilla lanigera]|uniref:TRAF-interacting protein with FHA domain-containing protein A isoform X2 n=1 Tax=Chinchilla lanigera TaxID=34839 RepID=UPI00038EEAA4|nr:PREDICTED: TRAF-interacting protein with FHA domain-containing protein A isoform X2 [Chinchilla lanigera]